MFGHAAMLTVDTGVRVNDGVGRITMLIGELAEMDSRIGAMQRSRGALAAYLP
jgi:hypothetical protein